MKKMFIRNWFLVVVSLLTVGAGVAMTVHVRQPFWLAVAGSVITCLGAVAACRKFIRMGFSEAWVSNIPHGGGAILPTEDDLDQARQADMDDRACLLASILVLIGTPLQIIGYLMSG